MVPFLIAIIIVLAVFLLNQLTINKSNNHKIQDLEVRVCDCEQILKINGFYEIENDSYRLL